MFRRFANLSRIHFVGIGGAGMSGIAEVLSDPDYSLTITGSDQALSETTERLESLGIGVFEGHDAANVEGAQLVVVSSAISGDNPEIRRARELDLPIVPRAEMLGELMRLKYGIAIAGTHGKTTTTSLVGTILTEAGLDPTVIVGGRLRVSGTGARLGRSEFLVAEADEYDRSFLRVLQPVVVVITSIDSDHLDTYGDLAEIQRAFVNFASRVPFFGSLIVCLDDPNVQSILPDLADRRIVTYGFSPQASLTARKIETTPEGSRFVVHSRVDGELGEVRLPMPGRHNVHNALASIAVGRAVGLTFETVAASLETFSGVHRRFERIGEWEGAVVIDDYAHHPTEVEATLRAARDAFPSSKIHAVFQPHLYSRTRDLAEEFGRALLHADRALVTEIYPSRERPIPGVSGEMVVSAARQAGHRGVEFVGDRAGARAALEGAVSEGDVILTLGAGDIYRLTTELVPAEGVG